MTQMQELKRTDELDLVMVKLVTDKKLYSEEELKSPDAVVNLLGKEISEYDREVVCVFNINTKGQIINAHIAAMGGLNSASIEARNIFKSAILSNAAEIIMMHNHPSGDPTPSKEDVNVTNRIIEAGELLGIPVRDHIVVGKDKYYSFNLKQTNKMEINVIQKDKKLKPIENKGFEMSL